jgi:hypothetical protein
MSLRSAARQAGCALLFLAAGTCLTFVGATAAGADDSTSAGSPAGAAATSSTSGSSLLGGYQTSSTGSGITWSYEQPNLPVPATPTFELNLGYSTTTYNAGPVTQALASTLWPGQVAANAGGQLTTLLRPYFGNATPNINLPPWPFQATSSYPPGPSTPSTASQDSPGVSMESASDQSAGTATSSFGTSSGGSNSYALPSGFISVQSLGSSVLSTVTQDGKAVAQATSEVHGVSIAGGIVTIGQVTSTATSSSDGNQGAVTGTSTVNQVTVAGQPVTLDSSGIHAAGAGVPILGSLLPNAGNALKKAGISITLTNPTDTVQGPSAQRQLDGVQITIDLTTLDKQIDQLVASLPSQLQQQVIDKLPLPVPNAQILTIDLGWVNVQSAASPAFDSGVSGDPGAQGLAGAGASGLGSDTSGFSSGIGAAIGGLSGPAAADSGGAPSNATNGFSPTTATEPARLFQGIGAGLIALGVMLAMLLAWVMWRADRAVGALAGTRCVGEDPTPLHSLQGGT